MIIHAEIIDEVEYTFTLAKHYDKAIIVEPISKDREAFIFFDTDLTNSYKSHISHSLFKIAQKLFKLIAFA